MTKIERRKSKAGNIVFRAEPNGPLLKIIPEIQGNQPEPLTQGIAETRNSLRNVKMSF